MVSLHKIAISVLLADSFSCWIGWLQQYRWDSCGKNWGWLLPIAASPPTHTKNWDSLNSIGLEELNLANSHLNELGNNSSPAEPSDRTTALSNTLITVLWDTVKQKTELSHVQIVCVVIFIQQEIISTVLNKYLLKKELMLEEL